MTDKQDVKCEMSGDHSPQLVFSTDMITHAFRRFEQAYPGWQIKDKLQIYEDATQAGGSYEHFQRVYQALRGWQIFRGKSPATPPHKVFECLTALDQDLKAKRLHTLNKPEAARLPHALITVAGIKQTKRGPSLMAISKFLHFWNPKMFVIVDREMMENWVFEHYWIREAIRKTAQELSETQSYSEEIQYPFVYYAAVLLWCSNLLRKNPSLTDYFSAFIKPHISHSRLRKQLPDIRCPRG